MKDVRPSTPGVAQPNDAGPAPWRRVVFAGIRLVICGAALWWVIGSVNLHDRIELVDGRSIDGMVTTTTGGADVQTPDGAVVRLADDQLGRDADGQPVITYGLLSAWRESGKVVLLLGLAVFALVPFLQGYRITVLARAEQIPIGLLDGIKLSFAGNFLNFAAPFGSTAGDVFKAYYLARYTRRKPEAMTVVFVDRAIGLGSLLAAVAVAVVLAATDSRLAPLRAYILVVALLGVAGAAVYLSPAVRRLPVLQRLIQRLPRLDWVVRADRVVLRLWSKPRLMGQAVATTMVLQVLCAVSFVVLCVALGMSAMPAHPVEAFTFFSTGELIKALPGPPQGFGTAELAYSYFFSPFGSVSQILCAAFAMRFVMLLAALPGLVFAATDACKPHVETALAPAALAGVTLQPE